MTANTSGDAVLRKYDGTQPNTTPISTPKGHSGTPRRHHALHPRTSPSVPAPPCQESVIIIVRRAHARPSRCVKVKVCTCTTPAKWHLEKNKLKNVIIPFSFVFFYCFFISVMQGLNTCSVQKNNNFSKRTIRRNTSLYVSSEHHLM